MGVRYAIRREADLGLANVGEEEDGTA